MQSKIQTFGSCLTLNTCQRKNQIMLKKNTTSKKCANVGGGKCAKSCRQNPLNIINSVDSRRQRTRTES